MRSETLVIGSRKKANGEFEGISKRERGRTRSVRGYPGRKAASLDGLLYPAHVDGSAYLSVAFFIRNLSK